MDIVCGLNSDDRLATGALRTVAQAWKDSNPTRFFVIGEMLIFDESGPLRTKVSRLPEVPYEMVMGSWFVGRPSVFSCRPWFDTLCYLRKWLHYSFGCLELAGSETMAAAWIRSMQSTETAP